REVEHREDRRQRHDPAAPRRSRQHQGALDCRHLRRLDPPHLHRRLGLRDLRRREPTLLTREAVRLPPMVDEYTIVKSIHVLAAALWVGTGFAVNIAMTLGARSGEPATMLVAMRFAKFLGKYVFPSLALITLIFGIWLTESFYDWDLLWIQLGMAGLVVSTA